MAHWPKANHNFVAEYQGSSIPFVTSSVADEVGATTPIEVRFPGVTRWLEVRNTGAKDLKVGFTSLGVQGKGAVSGSLRPGTTPASAEQRTAHHANYVIIPTAGTGEPAVSSRWELKTNTVFFLAASVTTDFTLIAGITNIPNDGFVKLSGSLGYDGVG